MSTIHHSTSRHHTEWLSLLEISGPFLSLEVLLGIFPQGLDADEPEVRRRLHLAYEEWKDNQLGLQPDATIHQAWVRYVLAEVLEMPAEVIAVGSAIPTDLQLTVAEYQENLQPDIVVLDTEGERPRLLVQVLPLAQKLDRDLAGHHWKASPARRIMELLHATGVQLGLITNGEQWMLVNAPRGETSGFISWYVELWLEEALTLRAWRSLLGVRRFFGVPQDETLEAMLLRSKDAQHEITDQLGYQVRHAVEVLVQAIDLADLDAGHNLLADVSESKLYEATVKIMMRLVFLFAAEEQGLFPLDDEFYSSHYAASPLRALLREAADEHGEDVIERRTDAWSRLLAAFRAIHGGVDHERLRLPAYGGGLFDPDDFPFLEGRAANTSWTDTQANPLPINNRIKLHVLEALQLLQVREPGGERQAHRLSFRSLSPEQIGDIYEGLLDHTARRATELMLGLTGTRHSEPEVSLAMLESLRERGEAVLLDFLKEATGRSNISPLRTALALQPDLVWAAKLQAACGNDDALYWRIRPFAGLIRADDFDQPVVIMPGSIYVTAGQERRMSGVHHTPPSLTEPIVQHTLEPLVFRGPAEGKPREEWTLRSAAELLALKICDMAMGSGNFLVQVCRYLGARLVEAWEDAEQKATAPGLYVTIEGWTTRNLNEAIPTGNEERLVLARRLVAERCIYGVDKNPLAVEMTKLSLWLITLDKGRAFSFLDHALKCGDSLIGIENLDQLRTWSLDGSGHRHFSTIGIDLDIQSLIQRRQQIEEYLTRDIADQQIKNFMLIDVEKIAHNLKSAANTLVASYYNTLSKAQQETLREALLLGARDGAEVEEQWWQHADLVDLKPFHWPLEFPEVFLAKGRTGFDAFVGNPPFIGGKRIRDTLGDNYRTYLNSAYAESNGNADYCALFFLRGYRNLQAHGVMGLIGTNTIAQGDTRRGGLDLISSSKGTIYHAINDRPWPGSAAVVVSIVHIAKGNIEPPFYLDGQPVQHISSFLDSGKKLDEPFILIANEEKSHIGSYVNGLGFILTPEEAQELIARNSRNRDVLFPYLNGHDLNSHPEQLPSRWIINFFDWPLEQAEQYPDCMTIIESRVWPERKDKKGSYATRWWQYGRRQERLYEAIASLQRILVVSEVSKYVVPTFASTAAVFSHMVVAFALQEYHALAVLQSTFHELWARQYSSSMGGTLRYTPTDVFRRFPLPLFSDADTADTNEVGQAYNDHRRQIMLDRWEGLTATYNRFHNPNESAADIIRLRELHVEMDNAVAAAYGWDDLALGHVFHETQHGIRYTIREDAGREVLTRLLELNHQRHEEEEKAGLHAKKVKGKKGQATPDEQMELL